MSRPRREASFSGGRLRCCSPTWKRAILVAVATFVTVVLLSFVFWPIPTSIEQLLESYPRDPQSLHLAGIVYAELNQTVMAERMILASLDIEPNDSRLKGNQK